MIKLDTKKCSPFRRQVPAARISWFYLPVLLTVTLLSASSASTGESSGKQLKVFVSILPQAFFVERVGGAHVEIEVLVGPGRSPATFEPTPQQMIGLSHADIYFRIGLPFEDRLLKKITATVKELQVVDTRERIKLRSIEGAHESGKPDPHIWLDPSLVAVQATTICQELSRLDPVHAAEYEANLQSFKVELQDVDAKIADMLEPVKGKAFYVFHPSFGYFADAYGLRQVPVEMEGKEPNARQLATLIENAKRDGVKAVFVQPQFSPKSAEMVAAAIGCKVVTLDPLSRDYLKNLEDIAEKIARSLSSPAVP